MSVPACAIVEVESDSPPSTPLITPSTGALSPRQLKEVERRAQKEVSPNRIGKAVDKKPEKSEAKGKPSESKVANKKPEMSEVAEREMSEVAKEKAEMKEVAEPVGSEVAEENPEMSEVAEPVEVAEPWESEVAEGTPEMSEVAEPLESEAEEKVSKSEVAEETPKTSEVAKPLGSEVAEEKPEMSEVAKPLEEKPEMSEVGEPWESQVAEEKENNVVLRSLQDELHKEMGGGCRGRGKGRGRGRGHKVKPVDDAPRTPEHSARKLKNRYPVRPGAKSRSQQAKAMAKSRAKAKAKAKAKLSPMTRKLRGKLSPMARGKAKDGRLAKKLFASEDEAEAPAAKRRARKAQPVEAVAVEPKRKARKAEPPVQGQKNKAKREAVQGDDAKEIDAEEIKVKEPPRRRRRQPVPDFKLSQIEIYYDRPACGLKVRCELVDKPETKTGWTQARGIHV